MGTTLLTAQGLTGFDLGKTITFKTSNGNEVTGVLTVVRHRVTGNWTYLELEEDPNGVYQTDRTAPITLEGE